MSPEDALAQIAAHGDGTRAAGAKAYHKSRRVHLGVPNPVLNDLTQGWRKALDVPARLSLADGLWQTDIYEARLAGYEALIEDANGWIGDHDYTYSMPQASGGQFFINSTYGALSFVLDDLGFTIVGEGAAMRERGELFSQQVSPEVLPEQDADFVFDTYRIDSGQNGGPQVWEEDAQEVLPAYCDALSACREGRLILLPREFAFPTSFRTLEMNVHYVVSHVSGRPGVADPSGE